ncbi:unnamed protein product [Pylaiella littoralis]
MGSSASSKSRTEAEEEEEERRRREEAIRNLQSAYVMLAPSSLEGVGVFAVRDVAEGVEVMRWDWHKYASVFIAEEELQRRVPLEVFNQLRRIWHVDKRRQVATPLDFTSTLSYINFLNHSDQPNLSFRYSVLSSVQREYTVIGWRRNDVFVHGYDMTSRRSCSFSTLFSFSPHSGLYRLEK